MTRGEYEMIRMIARQSVKYGDWEDIAQMTAMTVVQGRQSGKLDKISRGLVRRIVKYRESDVDRKEKGSISHTHERKMKPSVSLDRILDENHDDLRWGRYFTRVSEILVAPQSTEARAVALEAMGALTAREQRVAELRWLGWRDDEISEVVGVGSARVCQIRREIREKGRELV